MKIPNYKPVEIKEMSFPEILRFFIRISLRIIGRVERGSFTLTLSQNRA